MHSSFKDMVHLCNFLVLLCGVYGIQSEFHDHLSILIARMKDQLYIHFSSAEPSNPNRVLVRKLVLLAEGQSDKELDLTGDLDSLKDAAFTIKVSYMIKASFFSSKPL